MSSAAPTMSTYVGEYIWFDDNHQFRSKTRTFVTQFMASETGNISWPEWNYDGSSTAQAEGNYSEVILKPVRVVRDPFRTNEDFDFLLNISEDGWFGETIGPHQHFAHSIFRSIEEGKNLIRSANNGTSAFINSKGQLENKIKSTNSGFIEIKAFKSVENTIFSTYGNMIFFYFIFFYIILIFFIKKIGR